MNAIELFRVQADYNRWMNERLYAVCAGMSDAERRRDLGAFFRSIHGTLNHILLADCVWLGRLKRRPFPVISLGQELYANFDELRAQRVETDAVLADFVHGLVQEDLSGVVRYTSISSGQVIALLSRLGYDVGVTDLIRLPGIEPAAA